MNSSSRPELARLFAFQLRDFVGDATEHGFITFDDGRSLLRIADAIEHDAELGISYKQIQNPPSSGQRDT